MLLLTWRHTITLAKLRHCQFATFQQAGYRLKTMVCDFWLPLGSYYNLKEFATNPVSVETQHSLFVTLARWEEIGTSISLTSHVRERQARESMSMTFWPRSFVATIMLPNITNMRCTAWLSLWYIWSRKFQTDGVQFSGTGRIVQLDNRNRS